MTRLPRDDNRIPAVGAVSSSDGITVYPLEINTSTGRLLVDASVSVSGADGSILDGANPTIKATVFDLANSNPLATQLVDASGDAITSFGGGTQYANGAIAATPTGTVAMWRNSGDDSVNAVANNAPMPVSDSVSQSSLSNIDNNTASIAASVTGVSTEATLSAINAKLVSGTDIGDVTVNNGAGASAVNIQDGGNSITVDAVSLPLPTGAATATIQTDGSQKTQIVDGSGNVISSTSNALNTLTPDTTASGNITSNQSVTLAVNGLATAAIQVTGTWTGTLAVEGSVDGTNYNSTTAAFLANGQLVSNITANAVYQSNLSGLVSFRIRGNTVASGTAVVTIRGNATTSMVMLDNPLPAGSAVIGAVTQSGTWSVTATQGTATNLKTQAENYQGGTAVGSGNPLQVTLANTGANATAVKVDGSAVTQPVSFSNQSVNLNQLAGNTISSGVGTSGTGTLRTVIANDTGRTLLSAGGSASSSGNNTLVAAGTNKLKVYAFSLSTTSTTAVTCIFQSGASGTELWRVVLQAPTSVSTGANLVVQPPAWLFATASATLLNLNLSSAQTVHWSVSYWDEA